MESKEMLLPLPYIIDGIKHSGQMIEIPEDCITCGADECKNASDTIRVCRKGFDFVKTEIGTILFGFVVMDGASNSRAKQKRIKKDRSCTINKKHLLHLLKTISKVNGTFIAEIESIAQEEKKRVLSKVSSMKPGKMMTIEQEKQQFSFIHDYRQINAQLIQNMNVYLQRHYKESDIDNVPDEYFKALYYGIKLLEAKLDATSILLNRERLYVVQNRVYQNFHGIVKKICKIYKPYSDNKNIEVVFDGENHKQIQADPIALPIIPHTFIDNAIKYSPDNERIVVSFCDNSDYLLFKVCSLGPKIENDERKAIFEFSKRGTNAEKIASGSGLGLYLCNLVAKEHLFTRINFNQTESHISNFYSTVFSIEIPYSRAV